MWNEIILAIIQGATEFLPISSSGHLVLYSVLFSEQDLFLFTALHFASLLAVLIFLRKEIASLLSFRGEYKPMWVYLLVATIPAALVGYFISNFAEEVFSNLLFVGIGFLFTGAFLFLTKFSFPRSSLNLKNSLMIGLVQVLALFPGISRSGVTISTGIFTGLERKRAIKFSFLLFIPLALGAFIKESVRFVFSWSLMVALLVCFVLSYVFLMLVYKIVEKNYFWMFSIYCFIIGLASLLIYFL